MAKKAFLPGIVAESRCGELRKAQSLNVNRETSHQRFKSQRTGRQENMAFGVEEMQLEKNEKCCNFDPSQ